MALRHGRGVAYLRGKIAGLRSARRLPPEASRPARTKASEQFSKRAKRTILELEQQTGFDWYWRAYFWLSAAVIVTYNSEDVIESAWRRWLKWLPR